MITMHTARTSEIDKILEHKDRRAALIMPCVSRRVMLSPSQDQEMLLVIEKLSGGVE